MSFVKDFKKGIFKENPIFGLYLGLCPALAVSVSMVDAIGMGGSATFVLVSSSAVVSFLMLIFARFFSENLNKKIQRIRIPIFIVIIATFVTMVDLYLKGFFPDLHKRLGLFIPLIVVNCVILGRAEAFASKNKVLVSLSDAVGMGVGFTLGLCLLAFFREVLGRGQLFGYPVFGPDFESVLIMGLPPGAFLTMGLLMGLFKLLELKKKKHK